MTLLTVVLEKTLESPLDCKEIRPVNPTGNQAWIFIERSDAESETPILWPPDVKNCLKLARIEGRRRKGWDGCMASLTQRTWIWVNSGSWWWTGKPGVMQSMGLKRVVCDRATGLNWYFRNQSMCILISIPHSSWQLNSNSLYGCAIIFLNFSLLIRITHYLLLQTILLYKFYMCKVCMYV